MQAMPIPRRRTTHDATSTSPHPPPPCRKPTPHVTATIPATSTRRTRPHLPQARRVRSRYSHCHSTSPPLPSPCCKSTDPADAATDPADSTLTPPQPPPPCPQATHLAAALTQSHPHPGASAPHLLPHFPGLHPSYYIVTACTFISYIILHE